MQQKTSYNGLNEAVLYFKELFAWRVNNPNVSFDQAPKLDVAKLKNSKLAILIKKGSFNDEEIALILLAIIPHLQPQLLLEVVNDLYPEGTELPQMGGVKGNHHRGILPTGETAQFLIGGNQAEARLDVLNLLDKRSKLLYNHILYIEKAANGEPFLSGKLVLDTDYASLLLRGHIPEPELSIDFPAQKLTTQLTWDDLVLSTETLAQIKELETWLNFQQELTEKYDTRKKFKPGYRALFYGPPGTGKTLTATLLGKFTERTVYRVDLSVVVSKYIGETEKNLSKLFDKAANQDWILFFDEADAVFGKRTQVRDAHDKYANQEVSYLLQRLETHPGLLILASNFKNNIDNAFTRRFQSLIHFKTPSIAERKKLWQKSIPKGFNYAKDINLSQLAKIYEVSGSNILNIVHHCCLQSLKNGTTTLDHKNILAGLKREYKKEDKMF